MLYVYVEWFHEIHLLILGPNVKSGIGKYDLVKSAFA